MKAVASTLLPLTGVGAECCWSSWGDSSSCGNYPSDANSGLCNTDDWSQVCTTVADCSGGSPTPAPTPVPTSVPTPQPTPLPTPVPAPNPDPPTPTPRPTPRPSFQIGGYLENWVNYDGYKNGFNTVYYSFLTLDAKPNADSPQNMRWDGSHLYETMTLGPADEVMTKTDPEWDNQYEWQRVKVAQVMDDCAAAGQSFIWAIGGWSDLTQTIGDDQLPLFVEKVVNLLKIGGDGIDFDWEHLSTAPAAMVPQQRAIVGKAIAALRVAFNDNGLADKTISYTSRWNCFWQSQDASKYNAFEFSSDGECLDTLKQVSSSGVDWINLMMYDAGPGTAFNGVQYFGFNEYKAVLELGSTVIDKSKIVMGFEPGNQAVEGIWEGFDIDFQVIDYMKQEGYGGIMFWAINEAAANQNSATPQSTVHSWQGSTGKNSQYIAQRVQAALLQRSVVV